MEIENIDPFIQSVHDLFSTMLGCETKCRDGQVTKGNRHPRDVTVLIGLSGPARGAITLSFPAETALAMVHRLLGTEMRVIDNTVSDALGKMASIMAVSAKAKVSEGSETPISLGLPSIIRGNSYSVDYPTDSVWVDVPFTSELGPFSLRVTVELNDNSDTEGSER
jgi:chemotaxis protein CheX